MAESSSASIDTLIKSVSVQCTMIDQSLTIDDIEIVLLRKCWSPEPVPENFLVEWDTSYHCVSVGDRAGSSGIAVQETDIGDNKVGFSF